MALRSAGMTQVVFLSIYAQAQQEIKPTSTVGKVFQPGANFLQTARDSDGANTVVLHSQPFFRDNAPLSQLLEISC